MLEAEVAERSREVAGVPARAAAISIDLHLQPFCLWERAGVRAGSH